MNLKWHKQSLLHWFDVRRMIWIRVISHCLSKKSWQFYIVRYFIILVKTSWAYSTLRQLWLEEWSSVTTNQGCQLRLCCLMLDLLQHTNHLIQYIDVEFSRISQNFPEFSRNLWHTRAFLKTIHNWNRIIFAKHKFMWSCIINDTEWNVQLPGPRSVFFFYSWGVFSRVVRSTWNTMFHPWFVGFGTKCWQRDERRVSKQTLGIAFQFLVNRIFPYSY